jgi:hypothetical protein
VTTAPGSGTPPPTAPVTPGPGAGSTSEERATG